MYAWTLYKTCRGEIGLIGVGREFCAYFEVILIKPCVFYTHMDIVFDIETAPIRFGEYMVRDDVTGEMKDIGALTPITGRIIAIGWMAGEEQHVFFDVDEQKILERFWHSIAEAAQGSNSFVRFIGFNIKKFDLHFLLVRTLHHNIKITGFNPRLTIDLRETLTFGQPYMKKGTLQDYAELIGVAGKYNNLKASDIPQLWKEGQYEEVVKYVKRDVEITQALYLRCKSTGIISDIR